MSLTKYASFAVLAVESATGVDLKTPAASLAKQGHRHEFEYDRRPGYIYVRSRAISSRTNDNYDQFPAEEIKQAYRTFVGKPVFVNHHNSDHRRARGVIIDAALHEDMNPDGTPDTWVEVLMEVDAVRFPRLAEAVIKGDIARTSMGTDVAYSVCTACGNKASTPAEYCKHIPAMKGMKVRRYNAAVGASEEVLIAEVCYGLGFFENSLLVEDPADPTAYVLGVDGEGLAVAASKIAVMDDWCVACAGGNHGGCSGPDCPCAKVKHDEDALLKQQRKQTDQWFREQTKTSAGHPVEPVMILHTKGHLHSYECPHCGLVGRGLKDSEAAKDGAWAHALVCYDLDWDDEVTYKIGRTAAKDTSVSPSEHGDPRLQDAGVSVSKTKDGKYYVHTHRARGKYRDSVADIPDSEIEFIRSTGSLTKKADEDQCPYDAGDSMPIGGGYYACEDGDIWHPEEPAALAYHGDGPERGVLQPRTGAVSFEEFLRQAKTYTDDDVKTVKDLKKGDSVSWGRHRQFRDADVIESDGDKVRIRTKDKGVEWDIRDDELANFEHRLKRRKKSTVEHVGYGEVKAPAQVDTLRVDRCPVCHDDESFDGERCAVCGHVEPPAGFGDPDLEKAQQMDLRQDQQEAEQGDPAAFDPEGTKGEAEDLQCTNCGETFSAEGQPEAGPDEPEQPVEETDAQSAEAPEDTDPEADDDAEEPDDLSDLADLDDEDLDQALEEDDEDEDKNPFAEDAAEDAGGVEEDPEDEDAPAIEEGAVCPVCGVGTLAPLSTGPQSPEVEEAVVNPDEAASQIKAHLERILV